MSPLVLVDAPKQGAIASEVSIVSGGPQTPSVPAPANADRLTDPRFAAHTRAGGTGLGLRIARILARSMGGDLLSADGSFVLSLPLRSADR
ncbi:MAG TPA: hypothetical protein VM848_11655 [Acidimicrobiia bacterium]|nr:hypothetical protein [Acidimicrobiia bacterium]